MINDFQGATKYLFNLIPNKTETLYPGSIGPERTAHFLALLGNPQEKIKVIHLAGTSGKGSTAYVLSKILVGLGFNVGLNISPYILDLRERCQINNQLISEEKFVKYLNEILPFLESMANSKIGKPTYFEILTALAFYIFKEEKVDYAVIETGLGGLLDSTNVVKNKNKLVILTKIGLDHTKILGKTYSEIALQKAGIIQNKNKVLALWQREDVRKIFEKSAKKNHTKIDYIKNIVDFKNVNVTRMGTQFEFYILGKWNKFTVGLIGSYQSENAALALSAALYLSKRDKFEFNIPEVKKALNQASFPGRFDLQNIEGKTLIIDGAHNPQKMKSFLSSLAKIFPNQKFNFLIAFKKEKAYLKMLKLIMPLSNKIFITSFFIGNQDMLHLSEDPKVLAKILDKLNFKNYQLVEDNKKAFEVTLEESKEILVITGSLYFVSEIYLKNHLLDRPHLSRKLHKA